MRILAIDDEPQIRRLLEITLASKGWEVLTASGGEDGLDAARALKPDVVILDLNLPDLSGAEVLSRLRAWSSVPVIVLSVKDSVEDIVGLLEAGADDYLVKPFFSSELIARIVSVHRRRSPSLVLWYRSGRVSFELGERRVMVDGAVVRLTPTEYSVLATLAREPGKIVTRDRLLSEIWGPSAEGEEGSLRVHISALRKKLERDPAHPEIVITEPGVGYRLKAPDPTSNDGS